MTFIDIHCHILPGVDDGASNREETGKMLRVAYEEGIRTIIATPHYHCDMDERVWEKRKQALVETQKLAGEIADDFLILPGSEVFYSLEAVQALVDGTVWTLNESRYVLVEFPVYVDFSYIQRALQTLQYQGFHPILAHIERYEALYSEERVEELISMGVYLQANASSIIGKDGRKVKKFMLHLLKKRLIHLIGTDAHGSEKRRPMMKKCAQYIEKKTDLEYCRAICGENARKIIRRELIDA